MGSSSFTDGRSFGRKAITGLVVAGIAASVFYGVAGSAHDEDDRRRTTEERDLSGFTKIEVQGAIELELTAGSDYSVSIEARQDRIGDIITEIDGDTLIIDMEDDRRGWWDNVHVEVVITMPTLEELEVLGAVEGELHDIDSEELTIDVRGAADVEVEGTCGTLTLDVRGAGDIDADRLECSDVVVDVKGAGSASVYASDSIDARVAGVASISIYGDPKQVRKHEGGLSSITIK